MNVSAISDKVVKDFVESPAAESQGKKQALKKKPKNLGDHLEPVTALVDTGA